jgi:hypothetical protein
LLPAAAVEQGAPKHKFVLWSCARPAAAAAADFCGGLLNRLTGSRWVVKWVPLTTCDVMPLL